MHPELSRAQWRKSSYSGNSGNCVEVANLGGSIAIRDTKNLDEKVLVFTRATWQTFLDQKK